MNAETDIVGSTPRRDRERAEKMDGGKQKLFPVSKEPGSIFLLPVSTLFLLSREKRTNRINFVRLPEEKK